MRYPSATNPATAGVTAGPGDYVNFRKLLDVLTPRIVTEDVALEEYSDYFNCMGIDEQYGIVCSMRDIKPGERFDGIATMRVFNLFGMGLFPKQIGDVRPWVNPHDKVPQ